MIPPAADSEFVACMEDVLETYKKPCDKRFPVLCMDEQPVQLLKETRVPIPASKEHARYRCCNGSYNCRARSYRILPALG